MLDKVRMQLCSLFEDSDIQIVAQLVRSLAQCAPHVEAKFRDDCKLCMNIGSKCNSNTNAFSVLLPQLALLCLKNNTCPDVAKKRMLSAALFEAFSAHSCCFLSIETLAEAFVPGLRCLLRDLDPEHAKIAASILKDAETKLAAADSSEGYVST